MSIRPRPAGVAVLALIALVLGALIVGIALQEPDEDSIEISSAGAVQELIAGIPQEGAALGEESAPVTVEVFNDLQCPRCADYQAEAIVPLIEGPVREGEVRLVFHHYSLSTRTTGRAAYGAVAAGEQGRQWQYAQLFFRNQEEAREGGVTDEFLRRVAAGVLGLDLERWEQDLDSDAVREVVEADAELAAQRRLTDEPAVVVTGPRETRELVESPSLDQITETIAELE